LIISDGFLELMSSCQSRLVTDFFGCCGNVLPTRKLKNRKMELSVMTRLLTAQPHWYSCSSAQCTPIRILSSRYANVRLPTAFLSGVSRFFIAADSSGRCGLREKTLPTCDCATLRFLYAVRQFVVSGSRLQGTSVLRIVDVWLSHFMTHPCVVHSILPWNGTTSTGWNTSRRFSIPKQAHKATLAPCLYFTTPSPMHRMHRHQIIPSLPA
jgi:hypothetical protein